MVLVPVSKLISNSASPTVLPNKSFLLLRLDGIELGIEDALGGRFEFKLRHQRHQFFQITMAQFQPIRTPLNGNIQHDGCQLFGKEALFCMLCYRGLDALFGDLFYIGDDIFYRPKFIDQRDSRFVSYFSVRQEYYLQNRLSGPKSQ